MISVDDANASVKKAVELLLTVARLGEADHFGWWGTRSFGAAGRVVLRQRVPRTWQMAAIELDVASAQQRCNDALDRRNAVHLFSDNWPIRRWASAWVAEQKTAEPVSEFFDYLASATTSELVGQLPSERPVDVSASVVRIGEVPATAFDDAAGVLPYVQALAGSFGSMTSGFAVPYLEVRA